MHLGAITFDLARITLSLQALCTSALLVLTVLSAKIAVPDHMLSPFRIAETCISALQVLRTLALTLLTALTAADMGVTVAQCLYSAQVPGQILEDLVDHAHETLRGREVGRHVWC